MLLKTLWIVGVAATLAISWNTGLWLVDRDLRDADYSTIYNSCHKIWSARGSYRNASDQNTITSFNRAFRSGARGAEVDLYYDVPTARFVVSHDRPRKDNAGRLVYAEKDGRLLTLEALLDNVDTGKYLWLDFKNLDRLSEEETAQAISRLKRITRPEERNFLYLEGSNPIRVSQYTKAGFRTILAGLAIPDNSLLAGVVSDINKLAFHFFDITVLAFYQSRRGVEYFGKRLTKAYAGIPVFVFHVLDEEETIRELLAPTNIRAMLVGRDASVDRFHINACDSSEQFAMPAAAGSG